MRGGLVRKGRGAATCMQVPLAAPGIGRWCRLRGSWSRPPHSVAASDNPESPRCSSPLAAMLLESEVAGGMPWFCRGDLNLRRRGPVAPETLEHSRGLRP